MESRDERFRERLSEIGRGVARRAGGARRQARSPLGGLEGASRVGGVYVLERPLSSFASTDVEARILGELGRVQHSILARGDVDPEMQGLLADPWGALFLDTETTGLAGNMVFLLGCLRVSPGGVALTQLFAGDYSEEPGLLSSWTRMMSQARALVSFNGKAFDLPILRDRLGYHGLPQRPEPPHVDLLYHARRRWRDVLPDCRLQTLEWRVCGRRRAGDIPGEEIPEVYHRFVRTADPTDMAAVLHHNALDLLTLVDLALALTAPEVEPA